MLDVDVEGLRGWVEQGKGRVDPSLDLTGVDARSRRGVRVKGSKLKGTEMVVLPEGLFVTPAIARKLVASSGVAERVLAEFSDEAVLAVAVLKEYGKGVSSKYRTLLDALPRVGELDQPYLWTDEELEALRGSPLLEKVRQVREGIYSEWEQWCRDVFDADRAAFPESSFSHEMYAWAQGIIDSRCIYASSALPLVLAPILDQLCPPQPGSSPTAQIRVSGGGFFNKPKIVLMVDANVEAGTEMTLSCGSDLLNADYVLERGLAVTGRGAQSVDVEFLLTTMDPFFSDKEDILEEAGLETKMSYRLLPSQSEGGRWEAPEDMDAFLRMMCLGGPDAFLLEAVFRSDVWGHMALPVSAENERAMCEAAVAACEDLLDGYGVDEREASSDGPRQRLGRVIRDGERTILQEAVAHYRKQIGSLDAVEYYAERRLKALDLLRPIDESEIVDSESGGRAGRAFDENY